MLSGIAIGFKFALKFLCKLYCFFGDFKLLKQKCSLSFLVIINVIFVRAINSPKLQVVLFLANKIQRDFCKKSSCNTKLTLKDIVHKGGMRNVAIFRQHVCTDFVFFDKPATAIFNSKMVFHKMW